MTATVHQLKLIEPDPKKKREGKPLCTLRIYAVQQKVKGLKVIPEDHALFRYADDIGLPREFLEIAWWRFKDYYLNPPNENKKYRDWAGTFLNSVKGNYQKVWMMDSGTFKLTTVGQQAQAAMRKAK